MNMFSAQLHRLYTKLSNNLPLTYGVFVPIWIPLFQASANRKEISHSPGGFVPHSVSSCMAHIG
jgi:hypothetical protein